jgi:hypothetical protein
MVKWILLLRVMYDTCNAAGITSEAVTARQETTQLQIAWYQAEKQKVLGIYEVMENGLVICKH